MQAKACLEINDRQLQNLKRRENMPASYTIRDEMLHSIIHAVGILIGVAGILFLLDQRFASGYSKGFMPRLIYCFCFTLTFLFSTLYHGFQKEKTKNLFRVLDHISIYMLIAGTYTPIILLYINNNEGLRMLIIVWAGAVAGIILKIFFVDRAQFLSVAFYLLLGLFFLVDAKHFFQALPPAVAWLVAAGAILFVIGVTFYLWKGWRYHHAVWHLFSLAGGLCHFAAVFK